MRKVLLLFSLIISNGILFSQVAINADATAPNSSAMLDVKSTEKVKDDIASSSADLKKVKSELKKSCDEFKKLGDEFKNDLDLLKKGDLHKIGAYKESKEIIDRFEKFLSKSNEVKEAVKDAEKSELELRKHYDLISKQLQTLRVITSSSELKKKLESGRMIVAEDYIGTGLSWGYAKGADYKKLKEQNSVLIQEDLGILMDGERFLEGKEAVHLHEENDGWIRIVRDKLLDMRKEFGWKTVNANQPIENVFDDIKILLDKFIKKENRGD